MRPLLARSFVIALAFSAMILLILGISDQTGHLWVGSYFFIFAVVAYGLMSVITSYGPTHLPAIVWWFTLLPAMVLFYWPVALLILYARSLAKARRRLPASR